MLRSSIIVAVLACIVAVAAPSFFPGFFQPGGGPADVPRPAPTAPAQSVQAAANPDDSERKADIYADAGGQYSTDVVINGVIVHMMVDTGATLVVLSADAAERLGLPLSEASYTTQVRTANGVARAAPVFLDAVSIGDVYVPGVQGLVLERRAGPVNLLGESFLRRLSAVEQKSGRLVLRQ